MKYKNTRNAAFAVIAIAAIILIIGIWNAPAYEAPPEEITIEGTGVRLPDDQIREEVE